jgi:hypothetical protein
MSTEPLASLPITSFAYISFSTFQRAFLFFSFPLFLSFSSHSFPLVIMSGLRLLRIKEDGSVSFQEFLGEDVPPYAILSHRWIDGQELTFKEMQRSSAPRKTGYTKAVEFAQKARSENFKYCWIDTCC